MTFNYLKKKFIGEGLNFYVENGVHLETPDKTLSFKNWEECREFMYKLEEINKEAALTKERQTYGRDLILFYDEVEKNWVVWWKGHSIIIGDILLRELPIILRFFVRKYHKVMLDYSSFKLKEGFEINTGTTTHIRSYVSGF